MPKHLERQRAIHEFGSVLTRLLASQARNVAMGELDAPIDANVIHVKCEEMLDCFLMGRPEFEPFREDLTTTFSQTRYALNKDRWETFRKL